MTVTTAVMVGAEEVRGQQVTLVMPEQQATLARLTVAPAVMVRAADLAAPAAPADLDRQETSVVPALLETLAHRATPVTLVLLLVSCRSRSRVEQVGQAVLVALVVPAERVVTGARRVTQAILATQATQAAQVLEVQAESVATAAQRVTLETPVKPVQAVVAEAVVGGLSTIHWRNLDTQQLITLNPQVETPALMVLQA